MDRCLTSVIDWMRASKLNLKPDKAETLFLGRCLAKMSRIHLVLDDGLTLRWKEEQESRLGVFLGPTLSLQHKLHHRTQEVPAGSAQWSV